MWSAEAYYFNFNWSILEYFAPNVTTFCSEYYLKTANRKGTWFTRGCANKMKLKINLMG